MFHATMENSSNKMTNFSTSDQPLNCWNLIDEQKYTSRFWVETISLTTMNGLVIFGNFLVALAPFLNRRLRSPGHYFIASLAWADFALGVFVIPFAASIQTRGGLWPYGTYACQLWQTLDVMLCTTSIYSLIAITFDRYVAVSKPLMYKSWMTTRTCALLIMAVWLGSLAVSIPSIPMTWTRTAHMVSSTCKCTPAANGAPFILYSAITSFFLPMIIVLYFYAHIYVTVRKIRLNATRGVVNIERRSPTTTTGLTSMNNNKEFQSVFLESSALAVSTMEVHTKKFFTYNRMKKSRATTKSTLTTLEDMDEKKSQAQEERTHLLPPDTPLHQRRTSDGPVLRIHKGGYRARNSNSSWKSNQDMEMRSINKGSISPIINQSLDRQDSQDMEKTRTWSQFKNRLTIPTQHGFSKFRSFKRSFKNPTCRIITPTIYKSPSPSPSQLTLSPLSPRIIEPDAHSILSQKSDSSKIIDQADPPIRKTSKTSMLLRQQSSRDTIDQSNMEKSTDENPIDDKPEITTEVLLRLALPSQIVAAWAQRMLALHRYRRKLSLELRALKTVVMVTGCFFVCWTGFCVVYTMQALPTCHRSNWWHSTRLPKLEDSCIPDWVFNLFIWLGYANSAANPIVYGAMNAQFRRTFRRLVSKIGVAHVIRV